MLSKRTMLTAVAALGVLAAFPAAAQTYPNRPVKIIMPFAPGGPTEFIIRLIADRLTGVMGQPFIIENRPGGAGGTVGAKSVAVAEPDGYTLLFSSPGPLVTAAAVYKNLGYDYVRDFAPVYLAARAPLYLALNPKVPANTLQEFIALAKAKPGTLNYGSSGIGSTHHLTMEAMKASLGLELTHIPFKGTGQAVPALIGGQVDVLFSALPSLVGFVKSGQVKLVASNAAQRSTSFRYLQHRPGSPTKICTIWSLAAWQISA